MSVPPDQVVECNSASRRLHTTLRDGDLWIRRDGGAPEPLVERATAQIIGEQPGVPLSEAGIYGCVFAPDERSLYFIADNYGTSRGVFGVSLRTGLVTLLDAGNAFFVVDECSDRELVGAIGVYRHEYFRPLPGFAYDWWVLIRPDGTEIGPLDQDENVDRFLARRCGQGTAPPNPPARFIPPLAELRAACPAEAISWKPIPLLDGTTLDVFVLGDGQSTASHVGADLLKVVRQWDCAKGLKL